MASNIIPGKETSEYAVASSNSVWGIVATILGMIMTFGGAIAEGCGVDTKGAIIAGACVAISGQLLKLFSGLGFIKSRTDIKVENEKK